MLCSINPFNDRTMTHSLWIQLYDADALDKAGLRDFFFELHNDVTEQIAHDHRYYVIFHGDLLNMPSHILIRNPALLRDPRNTQLRDYFIDHWILAQVAIPGYEDGSQGSHHS